MPSFHYHKISICATEPFLPLSKSILEGWVNPQNRFKGRIKERGGEERQSSIEQAWLGKIDK